MIKALTWHRFTGPQSSTKPHFFWQDYYDTFYALKTARLLQDRSGFLKSCADLRNNQSIRHKQISYQTPPLLHWVHMCKTSWLLVWDKNDCKTLLQYRITTQPQLRNEQHHLFSSVSPGCIGDVKTLAQLETNWIYEATLLLIWTPEYMFISVL